MSQTKAQLVDGKSATIQFTGGTAASPAVSFTGDTNTGIYSPGADQVAISTNGTGRLFVDSSGRLLAGASATATTCSLLLQANNANSAGQGVLVIARGTSSPVADAALGVIGFTDLVHTSSSTNSATILAARDGGTWTSGSSMPTRLVFTTTPDGSATATERLRITSDGKLGLGTSSPYSRLTVVPSAPTPSTPAAANQITIGEASQNSGYRLQLGYLYDTLGRGSIQSYDNNNPGSLILNGAGGNVGVGTTSPSVPLEVNGSIYSKLSTSGDATVAVFNSVASFFVLQQSDKAHFYTGAAQPIVFTNNNTERARIDNSGRLLVGTSSAIDTATTTRLQVQGDAYINGLTYAPGKNYAETSNTGSTSIVNTGITLTGGALYEIAVTGNPAPGGSGSYKNIIFGYISVMVDFSFGSSSVQATIYYDQTFAKNGSVGSFTVSAVFWNGSTENTSVLQSNWASNQIRVKVAGSGGSAQEVRLRRIF